MARALPITGRPRLRPSKSPQTMTSDAAPCYSIVPHRLTALMCRHSRSPCTTGQSRLQLLKTGLLRIRRPCRARRYLAPFRPDRRRRFLRALCSVKNSRTYSRRILGIFRFPLYWATGAIDSLHLGKCTRLRQVYRQEADREHLRRSSPLRNATCSRHDSYLSRCQSSGGICRKLLFPTRPGLEVPEDRAKVNPRAAGG